MSRRLLASALVLALSSLAFAQPLTTSFTFQGQLKTAGSPASGLYDARFRLYDAPSGGTQLGPTLCSDNLTLASGVFTTQLDFGAQFAGQQRFIEIDIRQDTGLSCASATGFTTLTPRQPLTAAPNAVYALNATTAATATTASTATNSTQLNGQPAAFYQNAANLIGTLPDARLAGTYSSTLNLGNVNNFFNGSFSGSGAGLTSLNASSLASGTLAAARLPVPLTLTGSGAISILSAENTSPANNAIGVLGMASGLTGATYGGFFQTASTSGRAVYGTSLASSGTTYGGLFENASPNGNGVVGRSTASTGTTAGVLGVTGSTNGFGVYGRSNSDTGPNYGGYFENFSAGGTGVSATAYATSGFTFGGYFVSSSDSGVGVKGYTPDPTGVTIGVYGLSDGLYGVGLLGRASATSGITAGIYATSLSPAGNAAYFDGPNADCVYINNTGAGRGLRVTAPGDTAVWAISSGFAAVDARNDATSGGVYGLIGRTSSPSGFGVYSIGNTGASGTKSFRIDHPDDPSHKYLLHYSTESPEAINFYRGTVTLNEQGEATIDLPAYFAKINKDPSYQLTALGAPMPLLHISQEISPDALAQGEKAGPSEHAPICSFTIAGGAPNAKVCWRIECLRNDRWVQTHGAPVEVNKQGPEDGTYQHPDLYGQPAEMGKSSALNR